ncbi:hypothetical protein ACFPYN_13905 [Paenisporosarcina macmurdoensis]|uniref:Uncharacterized protein n=1 Tax=Paenisporosarcina macmurdoensis TaxID=212659 RepID=A0ABW1LBL2_9BACL
MKMNVYVLNFNTDTFKVEADVVELTYASLDEQYNQLINLLDATGLDVIDYNDDIAILVDDVGFEKTDNPIYNLVAEDGLTYKLTGKLLFVRNDYNEESTDFGGITYEDIFHLRRLLDIQIIGAVK